MGVRSLLSLGFILIPVAITIGVLLGLDAYRSGTGQPPLFPPTESGGPADFSDNLVHNEQYCQKSYGIHPKSKGEEYTLNPNQWNLKDSDPSRLCVYVDRFGNGSYATKNTAPSFWVTWQYDRGPSDSPVHAFPNIKLDTEGIFPVQLGSINNVNVDLEWSYAIGNDPATTTTTTNVNTLNAADVAANVAIDMFLDPDATKAQDPSKAKFEVMVWLGVFTPSVAQPLGLAAGPVKTMTVNGTDFSLYHGQNQFQQNVLTWQPSSPAVIATEFKADLNVLIDALYTVATVAADQLPQTTDYLGYMGMGSEAYYSLRSNVTFSVPNLSMELIKK